jgi:beta-galactosidase
MENTKFFFGADYYPEHWPEERWATDAKMMAAAGFNVVRLAEFAWAKLEPKEDNYEFEWLDKAIECLRDNGIQIVLGTPTASAPPWLMTKQKDLFLVDQNGDRLTYGLRREYCPSNSLYHYHTKLIVTRMAEHYQNDPAVIGWQIDNEFGDRCYCEICLGKFHDWLKNRYQTLENLNEKWGTIFWSHVYSDWSQIPFRKSFPKTFITHNLMGFRYNQLDYYDNSLDLDVVSWDNYMRMQWDMQAEVNPVKAALSHDTMRGLKKQNFWVMEQQSGGGGWECVAVPPKPGELRLWTYQSIAHGADAIIYFRWRTSRTGTEQFWYGILDHHGIPGRRYTETAQVGMELRKIGEVIVGSQIRSQIAIMQSYDTRFAFQVQPNNPRFGYENHLQDIYRSFYNHHLSVDIISEKDTLIGYKVVIVPALYILTKETTERLEKFASSGGTVVFTPRTGVKDEFNSVVNLKLPGLVARMAGVEIEEAISLPTDEDGKVLFGLPNLKAEFPATIWADVLKPTTAKVIARYTNDYYTDQAAVTINQFKTGNVIYIGTMGDADFYDAITNWLCDMTEMKPLIPGLPPDIEITERWQGDQRILFLLNHTTKPQKITLDQSYIDLLTGNHVKGDITIASLGVYIFTPAQKRT